MQSLMAEVPKIRARYDPSFGKCWQKYFFFRAQGAVRDILRREDPLGIKYPQKKMYPEWHRLSDESLSGYDTPDHRHQESDLDADQTENVIGDLFSTLAEVAPENLIYQRKSRRTKNSRESRAKKPRRQSKKSLPRKTKLRGLKRFILNQKRRKRMSDGGSLFPAGGNADDASQVPADEATQTQASVARKPTKKKAAKKSQKKKPGPGKGWRKGWRPSGEKQSVTPGRVVEAGLKFAEMAGGVKAAIGILEKIASVR